jgi:hypothetical protein
MSRWQNGKALLKSIRLGYLLSRCTILLDKCCSPRQRGISKWRTSWEGMSIRNRCGYSNNPARRLERLTPNNQEIYVYFLRESSRFDVPDWLCSENFKTNSPLADKRIRINLIDDVCLIAAQAPGIHAQKLSSFRHWAWQLVRLRIDSRWDMDSMRW